MQSYCMLKNKELVFKLPLLSEPDVRRVDQEMMT